MGAVILGRMGKGSQGQQQQQQQQQIVLLEKIASKLGIPTGPSSTSNRISGNTNKDGETK